MDPHNPDDEFALDPESSVQGAAYRQLASASNELLPASSATLLRTTLDAASDGILSVHSGGSIVTFNKRFLDLWRIPAEFARRADNQRLISFVLDQLVDPGTFLRITRENMADPEREYFSLLRFKDGTVLERFSRPRLVGTEIIGRILTFRDVTERENLLDQAYDTVRTREAFLSAVADEVTNNGRPKR